MALQNGLKEEIMESLGMLPEETLSDVKLFLDYLQYRVRQKASRTTPYVPVALGGLWQGVKVTDEDIAEVRREMWENFGETEN